MRTLHVITSMNPITGGPCTGLRNLVPQLLLNGIRPDVLCLDEPTADYVLREPFTVYAVGGCRSAWAYSDLLKPWLRDNLQRYDVVVLHGIWQYANKAVIDVLGQLKKRQVSRGLQVPKLMVMPHGMLDPYFQRANGRRLKALRNALYWQLVQRRVIKTAQALLFTTVPERDLARQPFSSYDPAKEVVVGYGIQQPPAYQHQMKDALLQQCPALCNQPYFLFLSRIHEKKGVDLLLEAYAAVLNKAVMEQQPLGNFPNLLIAGPGIDTEYGKSLLRIIKDNLVLEDKVLFPGMLNGLAKWGAIHHAETFVLPSHQENFGIAVVEALACSVPVLISNEVNIYQEVASGGAGYTAPDTLEGTIQLLEQWLNTPAKERHKMRQRACAVYNQHYGVTASGRTFAQAMFQLANHPQPAKNICTPASIKTPTPALPFPAATVLQG